MQTDNDKKLAATDKVYRFNDTVKMKRPAYPKDYPAAKKHVKEDEVIEVHVLHVPTYEAKGFKVIK